jgi:hypothetical protein
VRLASHAGPILASHLTKLPPVWISPVDYRPSNRIGQALRWGTEGRKKLLLTDTRNRVID